MVLINPLDVLLGQTSKIRTLRFLIKTDAELNGREIAAAVGLSHVQCHAVLKVLSQHGVVELRRSGKSILYRANSKSMLVEKILQPLFEREAHLNNVLKEILSKYLKKPAPRSTILFGSFATGKARPNSDIDLLIIASQKGDARLFKEGLEKAEAEITIGFGNRLAPIVMVESEFKKKFKNKDKLVRDIVKEGCVLFGDSINDLITL